MKPVSLVRFPVIRVFLYTFTCNAINSILCKFACNTINLNISKFSCNSIDLILCTFACNTINSDISIFSCNSIDLNVRFQIIIPIAAMVFIFYLLNKILGVIILLVKEFSPALFNLMHVFCE